MTTLSIMGLTHLPQTTLSIMVGSKHDVVLSVTFRCHNTQHNDVQHNYIKHGGTQHEGHSELMMHSITIVCIECHYAECSYAKCLYATCHDAHIYIFVSSVVILIIVGQNNEIQHDGGKHYAKLSEAFFIVKLSAVVLNA
jgi:hypothetical protein